MATVVAASAVLNVPTGHGVQVEGVSAAMTPLYVPAGHATHVKFVVAPSCTE